MLETLYAVVAQSKTMMHRTCRAEGVDDSGLRAVVLTTQGPGSHRHPALWPALVALPHVAHPPPRPRVPAVSLAAVNVSSTDMKCALPAYTVPLLSIPARIRTCHQASSRAPLQDAA